MAKRRGGAVALSKARRCCILVSAWASANRVTLGQVAVDDKSNEITTIPRLLELLDLPGAWVTIDAMGCQKEIAGRIVSGVGDYTRSCRVWHKL
jgi:hypothetical protein